MNLIDRALILKKNPLFSGLELDLLLTIADKTSASSFDAESPIFRRNQIATRMYIITQGSVQLKGAKGEILATLSKGDFFGDEGMFSDKTRAYEAFAKTKVETLTISKTTLMAIIGECPQVAIALLRIYSSLLPFRSQNEEA